MFEIDEIKKFLIKEGDELCLNCTYYSFSGWCVKFNFQLDLDGDDDSCFYFNPSHF
jgi:hypothetical protein